MSWSCCAPYNSRCELFDMVRQHGARLGIRRNPCGFAGASSLHRERERERDPSWGLITRRERERAPSWGAIIRLPFFSSLCVRHVTGGGPARKGGRSTRVKVTAPPFFPSFFSLFLDETPSSSSRPCHFRCYEKSQCLDCTETSSDSTQLDTSQKSVSRQAHAIRRQMRGFCGKSLILWELGHDDPISITLSKSNQTT